MGLNSSQKRQVLYVKDIVKSPAWLAIKEIIRDFVYQNVGNNLPMETLIGMKLVISEIEGLVKRYEDERS